MNSSTLREPELSRSSFLNRFPSLRISSASTESDSIWILEPVYDSKAGIQSATFVEQMRMAIVNLYYLQVETSSIGREDSLPCERNHCQFYQ